MNEQVHARQAIGKVLALLPEERQFPAVMREQVRLHEHPARSTTRIKDPSAFRLEHGDQQTDDGRRREIFPAAFPFGGSEFTDEIFVDASDDVLAPIIT